MENQEFVKPIRTALVSVSDKSNLDVLSKFLIKNNILTLSTGGTFEALQKLGVNVKRVSEQTEFPEVMGGRVKTLHPMIHMGLLARDGFKEDEELLHKYQINMFDLLVVNLYPFEKKMSEGVSGSELTEFIDVGGPSMIRAGAKNFKRLVVLTSPKDYTLLEEPKKLNFEKRKFLAGKAFKHLSDYDHQIYNWLLKSEEKKPLRYGENPHQQSYWSFNPSEEGLHKAKILQGKELSFNNLIDLTAAIESLMIIGKGEDVCVVSVKHSNPCGVAIGADLNKVIKLSLGADPKSVFGGIIAVNQTIDEKSAEKLTDLFLECVIAPAYTQGAKEIFEKKKNLRILEWEQLSKGFSPSFDFKRVSGGLVRQDFDNFCSDSKSWELVSGELPGEDILKAAELSWKAVARLKSNAIAIASDCFTLGLGMGQVNRVDAVKGAVARWKEFHSSYKGPVVLASDAFFPFADSIELIKEAGIEWVVQPGGSIKDQDVIKRANEFNIGMFFTGKRYFLH